MKKKIVAATYLFTGWNEDETEYLRDEEREITVGMPCTRGVGSDCYPAFVSRVSETGKTVWIKGADWKAAEGHDYFGEQKYIITPNENSPEVAVRKRKNGRWQIGDYSSVYFGKARKYEDPHF